MTTPSPDIARPGDLLAIGPDHRWLAYRTGDGMIAAAYVGGALLRRDAKGWWTAGFGGERQAVRDVAGVVGTAPAGWSVLAEQIALLGDTEDTDTTPLRRIA